MDNMKLYNDIRQVPQDAQKPFNNGRFKGTDINPMWRIQTLTEQFGPCGIGWYMEPIRRWSERTDSGEVCAFVELNLYIKHPETGDWSAPIYGIGGSKMVQNEKKGPYINDECFKMATTDAISVACKNLGMGADIYWQSGRTKYSTNPVAQEERELETKPITKSHANIIREKCAEMGINIEAVYSRYGKTSVEEMTEADYGRAIHTMKKMQESS